MPIEAKRYAKELMDEVIENHAISRAYRMGQTRNVLVYRLLCENSVDEKNLVHIGKQQTIFVAFADKSVAAKAWNWTIKHSATSSKKKSTGSMQNTGMPRAMQMVPNDEQQRF